MTAANPPRIIHKSTPELLTAGGWSVPFSPSVLGREVGPFTTASGSDSYWKDTQLNKKYYAFSILSYLHKDIFLNFYVEWQFDVLCIPNFDVERIFHINIRLKIENALHKNLFRAPDLFDGIYSEFNLVEIFSNCRDVLGIKSR